MYQKFHRACWLEIDLGRIKNNFRELQKMAGDRVTIMPAVKANAYGHGVIMACRALVKLAPIGVFCLMASAIGSYGLSLISNIAKLLGTFYAGYILHILVIYLLPVWCVARIDPLSFFQLFSVYRRTYRCGRGNT